MSPTRWREAREAQARLVKMTLRGAGFPENFPMVFKGDGRNLMDWLATKGKNPRKHHDHHGNFGCGSDISFFIPQWEMDGRFSDFGGFLKGFRFIQNKYWKTISQVSLEYFNLSFQQRDQDQQTENHPGWAFRLMENQTWPVVSLPNRNAPTLWWKRDHFESFGPH